MKALLTLMKNEGGTPGGNDGKPGTSRYYKIAGEAALEFGQSNSSCCIRV